AGNMISTASFLSGLVKIETMSDDGQLQERWRPSYVLQFIQDRYQEPDIIIDITDVFDQRMQAIKAYTSQFYDPNDKSSEPQTYISSPEFLDSVIARARNLGKQIGVRYAEGFLSEKKIGIRSLDALL